MGAIVLCSTPHSFIRYHFVDTPLTPLHTGGEEELVREEPGGVVPSGAVVPGGVVPIATASSSLLPPDIPTLSGLAITAPKGGQTYFIKLTTKLAKLSTITFKT